MRTFMLIFAAIATSAMAQTTTHNLAVGTICSSSVQSCPMPADGNTELQTGQYFTQFVERFVGGDAYYCQSYPTWGVADLGGGYALHVMDCQAKSLSGEVALIHAEIETHSRIYTYTCGSRVHTTCKQTQWLVDGGFVEITK